MEVLLNIFQLPIIVLNVFGFLVSIVWLLVVGQWTAVLSGLVIVMCATFVLGFALLPTMLIAAPGIYFAKRKVTIGVYLFGFLASVYVYAIVAAWCSSVTFYYLGSAPRHAFWPLLLWSYGIATSPWTYMAQKDPAPNSVLVGFFAQVAYIVMMVSIVLGADLASATQIFMLVTAVGVFFHMRLLAEMQRAQFLLTD